MNAYVVKTKDSREYVEPILDDGTGPVFDCWPMSPVVAATPAQAKKIFLDAYQRGNTGVYSDDWPNLRVRLLFKDVGLPAGLYEQDAKFWDRISELDGEEKP